MASEVEDDAAAVLTNGGAGAAEVRRRVGSLLFP